MNMKNRIAVLFAGLAIVVSACAGAASPAPSEPPASAAPAPSTEPAPSTGPATLSGKITIWHAYGSSGGNAEFKAFSRILEKLQAANPDLEVEALDVPFSDIFKNFETESAAGGGPDLFIAPNDSLGNEVRGGFLADLTGKIDDVLAGSSTISVEGSKVDGVVYMVPESLKAVAMYYDADKVPNPPKTTDELMAFVQGGGKAGLITGAYFGWGFYYGFGGKIFDDTGKCAATANAGVGDGIKYVADLKAAGALVDPDYGKVNDAFLSGQIDIMLNGNWTLGDYRAARPALGVAPVPAGPAGPTATLAGVDGWYINSALPNQDLAIAVAKFLTSQEAQEIEVDVAGHVAANKNVAIIDPLVKSFSEAIDLGFPRPQSQEFGNYWGPFGDAWSQILDKGTDPATAVAQACTLLDQANKK